MIVSLYANAFDDRPRPWHASTFEALAEVLGDEHDRLAPNEKGKTPNTQQAFSAAEFDGKGRKIPNVVRVHFGAVDVDKKTPEHVARVLDRFSSLRSFVYSTYSHGTAPGVSLRWLFPFSRPIEVRGDPAIEWDPYIAGFQALTDDIIDTETDPTRLFFVPTCRPDPAAEPFLLYSAGKGQSLDVDAVIRLGKERIAARHGTHPSAPRRALDEATATLFTLADLKDVAATCKRSRSSAIKEVGAALAHVADEQVYTREADRDDKLFRMCGAIAEYFPFAQPEIVAALFRPSIEATNAYHKSGNDAEDVEKVAEKLTRLQEKTRARIEERKEDHEKELRAEISAAFAAIGIDRDTAYTEAEIARIKSDVGATSFEELTKSWIIQQGTSFYLNVDGRYLAPIGERSLLTSARRDLAPASTAGVKLSEIDAEGNAAPVPRDVILGRYATAARNTLIDLNAQRTTYDRVRQTVIEAPCPIRTDLVPRFHPEIDEWLTALGGPQHPYLKSWVEFITFLDRPCVAIYLDGAPGVGKTLFAKALSRIWTKGGPTALKDALRDFNDAIMRCPLLLADETLPKDVLGDTTSILREFQQNTTRKVNRKGIPIADMVGAIRLIMCSNNKHMIETSENLTNVDIEAISERILYMCADTRARDILKSWGDVATARVVTDDLLAQHALYLRDKAISNPRGRFLIAHSHGHNPLSRALTTQSGDRSIVCHWLVSYLQQPSKYDLRNQHLVHIREKELWVNAEALTTDWDLYVTNAKPPRTSRISAALAGLALPNRKQARIRGHRVNFYILDPENLITWAEANEISSREQIEQALRKQTKIAGRIGIGAVGDHIETDQEDESPFTKVGIST